MCYVMCVGSCARRCCRPSRYRSSRQSAEAASGRRLAAGGTSRRPDFSGGCKCGRQSSDLSSRRARLGRRVRLKQIAKKTNPLHLTQTFSSTCSSFNDSDQFQQQDKPIRASTLLILDAHSGRIRSVYGSNKFYMPHGLTIDWHGHIWLTDVALHQVLKYQQLEDVDVVHPSLVIGQRFQPGSLSDQLCKPTSVAVATTGEV